VLKLTYGNVKLKNLFGGYTTRSPFRARGRCGGEEVGKREEGLGGYDGEGKGVEGGEARGGEGRGFSVVQTPLR